MTCWGQRVVPATDGDRHIGYSGRRMNQRSRPLAATLAAGLLAVGLVTFYYAGATEHGRRINTARARADQSGYLWDAVAVYKNWHGAEPQALVGERNRLPVYPGLLALF